MKYILVHGGVISGVGKGIISSSIGTLMKSIGLRVTAIKIDPYINIDAGTFNPYEHGETYVLNDGGECDLDLGNYERFISLSLTKDNNITTGKMYSEVIQKERNGDYLGKTVQIVPHVTDHIMNTVERVAKLPTDGTNLEPEVCIIELGGTIGDIESMPFVEAFRQFEFNIGKENFMNLHVSLVPTPGSGEQKTKPIQNSVRTLRGQGLSPDMIVCRCKLALEDSTKRKISQFCSVPADQVISVHDVGSIYRVPLILHEQKVTKFIRERLQLPKYVGSKNTLKKWRALAIKSEKSFKEVTIAFVGKYIQLEDAYVSVIKALKHSALAINRKLVIKFIDSEDLQDEAKLGHPARYYEAFQKLCSADGVIVPGGFGTRGTEGKITAINWAREHKIPFLGICLGMQLAVVEFSRNVMGLEGANSAEFDPKTKHPVIISMPEHHTGVMGGTMRCGQRETIFKDKECVMYKMYGKQDKISERHRHRYEVNPDFVQEIAAQGLKFVGEDVDGERMEIIELKDHPFFVGLQAHPEFESRPLKPSPPYLALLLASIKKLDNYIENGCNLTTDVIGDDSDEEYLREEDFSKLMLDDVRHAKMKREDEEKSEKQIKTEK